MRITAVINLLLVLSFTAARAQNEDTRDLPSASAAGRSSPPPERNTPRESAHSNGSGVHLRERGGPITTMSEAYKTHVLQLAS
jgi:hypothetical protein